MTTIATPNHEYIGKWGLITYRPEEIESIADSLVIPPEVDRALRALYTSDTIYPPDAIFKFLLLFAISTFKHLTSYYRWALKHKQFLIALGFHESYDVWVPSYKTFWHFMHIRVGRKNIYHLFDVTLRAVLPTIQRTLEKQKQEQEQKQKQKTVLQSELDVMVGAKAVLDATPIKATTHDTEASYNGHYKMKCYLWHRLIDVDTGIPLGFEVTTGSINEGHIGPALVLRTRLNQVNIRELWFDMKYAFGEALATYWIMGIETHYRISASWAVSQKYNWPAILRRYYKMWKDEEYRVNASYVYILRFLALRGYLRAVGLHLRNLRINEYLDAPDSYIETVSIRSSVEASNGYAKRISSIKGREFRGLKHVTAHIGFYELGRLILSYSRCVHDNLREGTKYLYGLS